MGFVAVTARLILFKGDEFKFHVLILKRLLALDNVSLTNDILSSRQVSFNNYVK